MASNFAAVLTGPKAYPLEVKPVPMPSPGPNQVLVKNHALAMNPIDHKLQFLAVYPMPYPAILGQDVAGEVIASESPKFQVGDRVLGCTAGFSTKRDSDKGFQSYSILESNMASILPASMEFKDAAQLPLAISTAAAALFNPDHLALQLPAFPAQPPTGKTLLVWGGASSVGAAAIQLARAAGYDVVSTASTKNFDLVKKLGAEVFDYKSATVVQDIVKTLEGRELAGAFDAVGGPAWTMTMEVVDKSKGAKAIATTARGFPEPPTGIRMAQVMALTIMANGIGEPVWSFVGKALQAGAFVAPLETVVAGTGLEHVQTGLDLLKKGVSAQKVVVTL